jgi:hypothetical protein
MDMQEVLTAEKKRSGSGQKRRGEGNPTLGAEELDELILALRGCCKGSDSLVKARELGHREKSHAEIAYSRRSRDGK